MGSSAHALPVRHLIEAASIALLAVGCTAVESLGVVDVNGGGSGGASQGQAGSIGHERSLGGGSGTEAGKSEAGESGAIVGSPTSGPEMWLRADAGVIESEGKIARWSDQTGNGHDGSMSNAARRPVLVENGLNGLPVVRFDGAQSLYLDSFIEPIAFSIFVVGKSDSTSHSLILGPGGNVRNNQLRFEGDSQVLLIGTSNGLPPTLETSGDNHVYHALALRYDGATLDIYRDGKHVASDAFSTSGPWTFAQIGGYYSDDFARGALAEVIVYYAALPAGELASTNAYLIRKYALGDSNALVCDEYCKAYQICPQTGVSSDGCRLRCMEQLTGVSPACLTGKLSALACIASELQLASQSCAGALVAATTKCGSSYVPTCHELACQESAEGGLDWCWARAECDNGVALLHCESASDGEIACGCTINGMSVANPDTGQPDWTAAWEEQSPVPCGTSELFARCRAELPN
jgi:hypothetical protein